MNFPSDYWYLDLRGRERRRRALRARAAREAPETGADQSHWLDGQIAARVALGGAAHA